MSGTFSRPGVLPLDELVVAHVRLAHGVAWSFYIPGYDREDVTQEAMLGLIEAAHNYDPALGAFPPFAATVIRRRLYDRITAEQTEKRLANHRIADDITAENGDTINPVDLLHAANTDPATIYEQREPVRYAIAALPALSPIERASLTAVINGRPYVVDGVKDKQADNALQRARRKLREAA